MKKIKKIVAILFLSGVLFSHCGKNRVRLQPDPASYVPAYQQTVKEWTREGKIYNNLETILIVNALYKNEEVRSSFVEEYAQGSLLAPAEKEEMLKKELKTSRETLQFLVAIYSGNDEWSKLKEKESIWSVILEDENGNQYRPLRIKELKHEDLPLKDLYGFITPWKRVYEIEFSPGTSFQNLNTAKLIISSVMGRVDLTFP